MRIHKLARDAVAAIQSGNRVFVHGGAATPTALLNGVAEHAPRLKDVEFTHLHTMGAVPHLDPKYRGSFKVSAFFLGGNMRPVFEPGYMDYIPCFLSEIPNLFRSGHLPLDVALIHVSPPDERGYCTLGTSVDIARAATEVAKVVIAQINPKMPRVLGDGLVHISKIHHAIEVSDPIHEDKRAVLTEDERNIAKHCASLIGDGATLQMGIGAIPDAVLGELRDRKHLGIHTEMWSDGALELMECGAVDNSLKALHPGRTVAAFIIGSRKVYDYIDNNQACLSLDVAYVNLPWKIARNPNVVAINSAVEVDLTGQVCADSIGPRMISGAGGQVDFIRGASLSPGGKPIIALTSRAKKGMSRIVPMLKPGAGVVTTRCHVHYVITEFGIAQLYGRNLDQRARALISIAHPEEREALDKARHQLILPGRPTTVGTKL